MQGGITSKWSVVIVCACTAAAVAEPGRVIYVDAGAAGVKTGSSWADACNHLQNALALAAAAEKPLEIRVAQGIFKPDQGAGITPGDRTATFKLLNGVAIKGGYAGGHASDPDARDISLYETILSGDLADNDGAADSTKNENSFHIVTGSGTDNTAVIDGFTITAGSMNPPLPFAGLPLITGAGMLIDAGSPTILNCCFRDNFARSREVLMAWNGSNPIVTHCTFLNNQGTGMGNVNNSNSVVTDCRFEGNAWKAMDNQKSSPVITGCQFSDNASPVIQFLDCNAVLTDCVFEGGNKRMGIEGIHCIRGRLSLTGCTLTGFKNGAMEAPDDLTLVRCTFRDNSGFMAGAVRGLANRRVTAWECVFAGNDGSLAGAMSGVDVELHDCEFTGNSGDQAGAIESSYKKFVATGCVFSGNSSRVGAGAVLSHAETIKVSNCTFVGNRGPRSSLDCLTFGSPAWLTQCILRDGPEPFATRSAKPGQIDVSYCNVQGGYPGEGNIDVDPCFVDPGYWADPCDPTKEAGPDDPNAVWIAGDYHLKSQGGHWDRATETWIRDEATSRCIDAGDPNAPVGTEPFPNGGFVNLGAYGGTAEASKSYFGEPVCESQMGGDINGDCIVDQADLDILQLHWLMEGTVPVNSPPTITLLSPRDGDEFTYPTPILFQSVPADSDGTVICVRYIREYRIGNSTTGTSATITDSTNGWDYSWAWSNAPYYGTYTVWAEVTDNEGARTSSPKITVTFHPAK